MNGINGLFILIAAGCLGMFLHYAKKAMMRELWQGDTEPNPFRAGFWVDFYLYMFVEHPGRTAGAILPGWLMRHGTFTDVSYMFCGRVPFPLPQIP